VSKKQTTSPNAWSACVAPAWHALKTYWPAILFIQGLALALVFTYYGIESSRGAFNRIATLKMELGPLFAAICTVFSGGIFPELIKRIFRPKNITPPSGRELIHQFIMWAWVGILVDRFYMLQSTLFGDGTDAATLIIKVLADQFVFTPLICLPLITLWFMLGEAHYRLKPYRDNIRLSTIRHRVLPLWATCLIFWPVMLCIVYSLPADLQFPLFLLGNAAYSILMIFIIRHQHATLNHTAVPSPCRGRSSRPVRYSRSGRATPVRCRSK
jgi:hypothetical protein